MNSNRTRLACMLLALLGSALVAACGADSSAPRPDPVAVTRDDTGYFCGMIVEDHAGPKSQIFVRGSAAPLWFTTARDGIAFTRLPEETRPVLAFYVSAIDLGGWDHPEADSANMIAAAEAWFVVGSDRLGSMGAPEAIPFLQQQAARDFAARHGGDVARLQDIPQDYILGPGQAPSADHAGHAL